MAATDEQAAALTAYVNGIRNAAKKRYAVAYVRFMEQGGAPPTRGALTFMGAQAVELRIAAIYKEVE